MSGSSSPYNFHASPDGSYEFQTSESVGYWVYFTEWSGFLEDYPELEGGIRHFGFSVVEQSEDKISPDKRTGETIRAILKDYFEKNPLGVIVYFVDNQDGKHEGRKRKFDQWYRADHWSLEKLDGVTGKDQFRNHFSLIFERSHPNRDLFHDIMGFYRMQAQTKP